MGQIMHTTHYSSFPLRKTLLALAIGAATAGIFAGMLFMLRKWKWSPMLVMAVSGGLGALLFGALGL